MKGKKNPSKSQSYRFLLLCHLSGTISLHDVFCSLKSLITLLSQGMHPHLLIFHSPPPLPHVENNNPFSSTEFISAIFSGVSSLLPTSMNSVNRCLLI